MNKANTYFNQHFFPVNNKGRKEDKSYIIRQRWKELGFPSYVTVDEDMNLPKNTTAKYASKYGYKQIKETFQELQEQEKSEQEEKDQQDLRNTFKEVWDIGINDTKYQLQSITTQIQDIEKQMGQTDDADMLRILSVKLDELWDKHNFIFSVKFPKLQDKARTNVGLTNNYKDNSVDKLEVKQEGELTLNQNIVDDGLTEEERREQYEAEFTRLLQEATTTPTKDAQDIQGNNNR